MILDGSHFFFGDLNEFRTIQLPVSDSSQHKGVLHLLPYKASYGAILIVAWWLLLYVNSTNAICSSQFPSNSSTYAYNRSSKTWMTFSDWPLVWGWNAMLISNLIPKACYARLKSGGEHRIPIRDNGYRNPMESYHIVYVNIGKLVYRINYLYG
jgi:hypothetical protein